MNRDAADRPRWVQKLFTLIEKHWRHHGPCNSIRLEAHYSSDSMAWEVEAAPAFQEIFGGEQDGQRVWTGFVFEAGEFSKETGLWLQDFAVASQCAACCPRPKMMMKGKFRGHNVFVTIRLEPEKGTPATELLDTITKMVRPTKADGEPE
jgi:hypothetical protein